ncbi:MAG: glycosyltransferase family 2 protein [Nitrospirae bacterium]|nr:glycosyltransferase family 2 protein [Nitrospirota bacterium]
MISIIIPTYNAGQQIHCLCEALRSQAVSSELIVIDSSSSDRTAEIAESFGARVLVVRAEDFDHGGTRTLAGKAATGDILIYMTQDALPFDKHSIGNIAGLFDDQKIAASYGRQLPYPNATAFGAHLRLFNYPETPYIRTLSDKEKYGIKTPFLSNSFAAYRRSALDEIRWFKEKLILGEDTYAGAKLLLAGYTIAYVPDAMVYHSHNYTVIEEFKRYFDIGVFHKSEQWIIEEFGKAEGEGGRYMKSAFSFLRKNRKYCLIPEFVVRNILKYLGYTLGRHYDQLPYAMIRKLSRHEYFWSK